MVKLNYPFGVPSFKDLFPFSQQMMDSSCYQEHSRRLLISDISDRNPELWRRLWRHTGDELFFGVQFRDAATADKNRSRMKDILFLTCSICCQLKLNERNPKRKLNQMLFWNEYLTNTDSICCCRVHTAKHSVVSSKWRL